MFNEQEVEKYKGKNIPVWQSPKYEQSRKKALEIIKEYERIEEADFWILMNTIKGGETMMYSGLIISHNGCLKINDAQSAEKKFKPSCVTFDKEGYNNSLVFTYCNDEQGIYEVGEVSAQNCKNSYPYAMAYKRLFDRVVLKLCGLAYDGVYSDSEADEFKQRYEDPKTYDENAQISKVQANVIRDMAKQYRVPEQQIKNEFKVATIDAMRQKDYKRCMDLFEELKEKLKKKVGDK